LVTGFVRVEKEEKFEKGHHNMKKLLLCLSLFTSAVAASGCIPQDGVRAQAYTPFTDISTSYAQQQILELYAKGIIKGEGDQKYSPQKQVTREALVAMQIRTLGLQPVPSGIPAFKDVPAAAWSYGSVQAALIHNLVTGVTNDTFAPQRPVTRQEAAVLLYRALQAKEAQGGQTALPYKDADAIAAWARPAVSELYTRKVMVGNQGYFRPNDALTREEIAMLLSNLLHQPEFQAQTKNASLLQMGWDYDITTEQFSARAGNAKQMNMLSPRWYFLSSSGKVSDYTDQSLLAWAQKNKREVWPLVGNHFNRELTHQVLTTSSLRQQLISQLVGYTETYKLTGLNIDFEDIDPADRQYFTAFITELSSALHAKDKKLSVDVPPDLGDDWSEPYDFAALARTADYVVMMAYNETWEGKGIAGPNASLPWVQSHVTRILKKVPKERLIVALPFYTMRWQETGGKLQAESIDMAQSFKDVQSSGIRPTWDARLGLYYVMYRKNGSTYKIWLEESRSLALKYRAVKQLGAAGVAFWYIGAETGEVWPTLYNE
jgi:spore germination protein